MSDVTIRDLAREVNANLPRAAKPAPMVPTYVAAATAADLDEDLAPSH